MTFPLADGLPTIPTSDPRYGANANQRIFGIPLAPYRKIHQTLNNFARVDYLVAGAG